MRSNTLQLKRAVRAVLFVLLLSAVGMTKVYAQYLTVGDIVYSINDDGISVTVYGHVDGTAATGELVIPETVTYNESTYSVTAIRNIAFNNCSGFTGNLVIPNSVTTIGGDAFSGCTGFTGNLVIPNSVTTIRSRAFSECSGFTGNLDIPNSVTTIYGGVFNGCTGFTSLTLHWEMPPVQSLGTMNYDIPVTVPCCSASLYRYSPNWSNFTNYQEDCTGMLEVSATANPGDGGRVIFGTEGETLLTESFEEYTVGNTIATEAEAAGHDWWTTWDGEPGGENDGYVAEYDATQCAHFTYGNDQVLLLGDKVSGIYDLEFDILVPEGKNAFFSLLHHIYDGTYGSAIEAIKCHLHASNSWPVQPAPGIGTITLYNDRVLAYIPCVFDAWMHFRVHVDIDADLARFFYTNAGEDELFLFQWQWSSTTSESNDSTLAAVDFWPPVNSETSEYYVDNITLKQFDIESANERPMYGSLQHFAPGATCTLTALPNEDFTFANWTEGGTVVSPNPTHSFTVTEDAELVANFEAHHGIGKENITYNSLYPNPTNGMITVEAENMSEIVISNMMGQIVARYANINDSSANINMNGYEKGTYLVRIITGSSVIVKNVVKM